MNNKENHINYSSRDIENYISGTLTPIQMHAMEKAALDDAFLAEAIEGYGIMQSDKWKNELTILKENFEIKAYKEKIISLPKRIYFWWKTAAAVLLIVSAGFISYLLLNKNKKQAIAQTEKKVIVSDSEKYIANINTITIDTIKPVIKQKLENIVIVPEDNAAGGTIVASKFDSDFVYKPTQLQPEISIKNKGQSANDDTEKNKNIAAATNNIPTSIYNNNLSEGYATNKTASKVAVKDNFLTERKETNPSDKNQQLNHNFIAQVVGPDNTPLPFANISIKKENFGTYTDVKGNFILLSTDTLLTVEIKSAGYQSEFYTLQSNPVQNKIVLAKEDLAKNQRTILSAGNVAKSKVPKRTTFQKDPITNAEPVDGWDNYYKYVDNNIEIPDDIFKNNLHGQVEISFDVHSNGTIVNIKVDKPLCTNCDEAAKRLVEKGPPWKIKNGINGRGKITVQF